jgi:hypothetical protein
MLALGAAFLASLAAAPAQGATLTATQIRVAEHPGLVRAVVDFTGGTVESGEVVATDPDPFADGVVRLPLSRPGATTTAAPVTAHGVTVSIAQGAGRITIRLEGAERRFKYVRYRALHAPERLAIDLYESAPPAPAAEVRRAPGGCLALRSFSVGPRRVSAAGRERHLFEHGFVLRLRREGGRIHAQRPGIAARGRWRAGFRYPRARRQTGTLEAVALSAKDGTLDCLVQVRVRLGGAR